MMYLSNRNPKTALFRRNMRKPTILTCFIDASFFTWYNFLHVFSYIIHTTHILGGNT